MLKQVAVLCLLANVGFATEIKEWETVFEQGAWRLDVNIWDDDSLTCETRSISTDGTLFSIESWPDGSFSVSLYNEIWRFPSEAVTESFVLRIDGADYWDVDAEKFDSTVVSYLDRTLPDTQEFLTAFYNGTSMRIESAKGTLIAEYALAGTGPTMAEHAKCENRIGTAAAAIEADPSAKLAKDTF